MRSVGLAVLALIPNGNLNRYFMVEGIWKGAVATSTLSQDFMLKIFIGKVLEPSQRIVVFSPTGE